LQFDS